MANLPDDPLAADGIRGFGRCLRQGEVTAESVTKAYLQRIEALDPRLGAYQYVAAELALARAREIDAELAAGTDLGPLMGVPVAVKDLLAVDGMPTTAGSKIDVGDLIGPEGSFVKALRAAGCVILGKTKAVEFGLGAVGISAARGTPWNPWDAAIHRIPGGSSSGSGVAMSAGLCGFAIGSDTGGSVRIPAALNGVFGLKTTVGLWATDGVMPLAPTLDSIGLLTASAADAAIAFAALTGQPEPEPAALDSLQLGQPSDYFFDDLEAEVDASTTAALDKLAAAGATLTPISVPEAAEREEIMPVVIPTELNAVLGRERLLTNRDKMDPVIAARAAGASDTLAADYIRCIWRQRELVGIARERMRGLDAWVSPTVAALPAPIADFDDFEAGLAKAFSITRNTQPGNIFDQASVSLPVGGAPLPVGLQLMCNPGEDAKVLAIALAVESAVGLSPRPDLAAFL